MNDELHFDDLLDPSFQQLLCACLVSDEVFLARARGIVEPEYFGTDVYRAICKAVFEYWDKEGTKPPAKHLKITVGKLAPSKEMRREWAGAAGNLYELPDEERNPSFIAKELIDFVQRARATKVVIEAHNTIQTFDVAALHRQLDGILKLRAIFEQLGLRISKDWALAYEEDPRAIFKTGYEGLDHAMRDGMREGELISILGPLKKGKTMCLLNIGLRMMVLGQNVVHYTLEMQELDVLKRYIAALAGVPVNHLEDYVRNVHQAMDMLALVNDGKADIVVKFFPARKVGIEALEAHYNFLGNERYVPIIDYGDLLLGPNRRAEEWSEISDIYLQLRNFGVEYGVPVITASQTNAGGFQAPELEAQHQSGSTRKAFHCDYMWSLNQSKIDYDLNRFTLIPFINRNERKDLTVFFRAEYDRAKMIEVTKEEWVAAGGSEAPQKKTRRRTGLVD